MLAQFVELLCQLGPVLRELLLLQCKARMRLRQFDGMRPFVRQVARRVARLEAHAAQDVVDLGVLAGQLLFIALRQRAERDAQRRVEGGIERRQQRRPGGFLRYHRVIGADAFEHGDQAHRRVRVQLRVFLQAHDAVACKPRVVGGKAQQARRQRMQVRRIQVEAGGADGEVLRVGRFHDQQAAGLERAQRFGDQFLHQVERQVLDQVERRYQRQAGIRAGAQRRQCIGMARGQAAFVAGRQHAIVEVHAFGPEAVLAQQFEPFAAAAPQVERHRLARQRAQGIGEAGIGAQPLLDDVARAAVAVFERAVERGLAHRWISTCGSSQLLPTNSRRFMFMTMKMAARSRHS